MSAQSCASVPPAPGWISTIAFRLSNSPLNSSAVSKSLASFLISLKDNSIWSLKLSSPNSINSSISLQLFIIEQYFV